MLMKTPNIKRLTFLWERFSCASTQLCMRKHRSPSIHLVSTRQAPQSWFLITSTSSSTRTTTIKCTLLSICNTSLCRPSECPLAIKKTAHSLLEILIHSSKLFAPIQQHGFRMVLFLQHNTLSSFQISFILKLFSGLCSIGMVSIFSFTSTRAARFKITWNGLFGVAALGNLTSQHVTAILRAAFHRLDRHFERLSKTAYASLFF